MNNNKSIYNERNSINLSRTMSCPIAESTHLNEQRSFVNNTSKVATPKRKPTSPLLNSKTTFKSSNSFSSFSRIDPQVYADAQSRGLVSRLVKYHEKSMSTIPKSPSLTNLYTKPGQFPVVHLRKNEIKYSPRRNNTITSVKIAPPDRSKYLVNSRSNIMRSGSVIMSTEQQLDKIKDNEPIAPSNDIESAPTRSVLDALKEISRKRINNEELDADRIKKQCKELSELDGMASSFSGTVNKRAREGQSSPTSKGNSAEQQLQKKRFCTKNNDISSSLSSSLVMSTPKRGLDNLQPRGRLNIDQTYSQTPSDQTVEFAERSDDSGDEIQTTKSHSEKPTVEAEEKLSGYSQDMVESRKPAQQQKITLFNKKYDDSVRAVTSDNDDEDEEDLGKINFIKPKDKSPLMHSGTDVLKRVEKSKLSLMLSCLSGDIDEEEEKIIVKDVVDSVKVAPLELPTAPTPIIKEDKVTEKPTQLSGITALITEPIKNTGFNLTQTKPEEKIVPAIATAITVTAAPVTTIQKPTQTVTFGIPVTAEATPKLVESAPIATKPITTPAVVVPSVGGFSFGKTTTATTTPSSITTGALSFTTMQKDPPPAFGSFSETPKSTPSISPIPTVTFSLKAPSVATSATIKLPTSSAFTAAPSVPAPNNFTAPSKIEDKPAFSILPAITTATENVSSTTTTTSSAINFGGQGISFKPSEPFAVTSSATTASATFKFGGNDVKSNQIPVSSTPAPTFGAAQPVTTSRSGGFSFGAKDNNASFGTFATSAPATVAPTSTATQNIPALFKFSNTPQNTATPVSTNSAPAPAFGFGQTATPVATFGQPAAQNQSSLPTFGQSTGQNNAPSFGQTNAQNLTSPPSFGQTNNQNSTATSSFGQTNVQNSIAASSFGQTASFNAPRDTSQSTANNSFSFGANQSANKPSNAFSFGGSSNNNNNSTPAPSFGSPVATNNNNTFGANTNAPPVFGQKNPPAFGNNAPAPSFGGLSASNSAPSFGGINNASQIFGANSTATTTTSNNQFSYNSSTTTAADATKSFSFGGASTTNDAGNNTFGFGGQSSSNQAPAALSKSNAFSFAGSAPANNSNSSFNFSTAPAAPAANNTFGAGGMGAGSGFAFGGNDNKPPAFGGNMKTQPPAFGEQNKQQQNSFAFGQQQQQQQQQPQGPAANNIFGNSAPAPAFGANNNNNSGFNFAANQGAGDSNFQYNNPPANSPFGNIQAATPAQNSGMFSIGTGGGVAPGRRPMRTATRRLNK